MLSKLLKAGDEQVLKDVQKVTRQDEKYKPTDPKELCNRIFHTCYMGTKNSSKETCDRAIKLSKEIGSYHIDANIDGLVSAMISCFTLLTGKIPKFKVNGGSVAENLALQNIQARLRMV
eukprot:UN32693